MMRTRLVPLALATAALLVASSCSSDDSADPAPPSSSAPTSPTTTSEVSSTDPAGTVTPTTTNPRPQGFASAKLEFFGDCAALLEYMQTEASKRVTAWGLGGGGIYYGDGRVMEGDMAATEDAAGDVPDSAPAPQGGVEGQDYSGTNVQEIGVDEGDIVETDGEHVYVASTDGVRIVAVDAADVVAEPELPQGTHQMLLDGDRLVVVTSSWGGAPDTIVSLFDVTDPSNPELLRRSHLEGGVVATRSVDGVARLVITTSFDQRLPFVQPNQFGLDEESALERNKEIIADSSVEDWLPRWFDESDDGEFGPMSQVLACETVAAPPEFAGLGLTWIGSIDVDGDGTPVGSAGIVSTGDTVYASTDNLYVATQNWNWQWEVPVPLDDGAATTEATAPVVDPGPPPTLIHQFRLDDGTEATYVASGQVEGRLLNQFAMSEFNGDLRVATTTDDWGGFGEQSESTVFVLRPDGDELQQISSIGGLGRDEQIYAVRFIDDLAYVVTFRQIDPLYVIDLTDPANPVEAGELKIPGYSAYLHPVGDGLLLGVGQDATDEGRTTGTQLSLFDVSDPTDPQRISTLPVGGFSEVEWDHKAFLFWPADGTIVLPVSPGWGDCGPAVDCLAKDIVGPGGGAVVAELDGRELVARGTISHSTPNRSGCWNPLQRSIVIGDELATIGLDQMKFSDRQSLEPRDSVSWGDPEQYGCYWYYD